MGHRHSSFEVMPSNFKDIQRLKKVAKKAIDGVAQHKALQTACLLELALERFK
jgi:hypothetical protein